MSSQKPRFKFPISAALVGTPILLLATAAHASGAEAAHGGITRAVLALIAALVAARLGGALFVRLGQPAVLGELVLGIIAGNLGLVGFDGLDFIRHDQYVEILAEIGIVLLLFQIGLESDLHKMKKVGTSSLTAAVLGVVASFALGYGVAALFLPKAGLYVYLFTATMISSSSIGIAARVFLDLGRLQTPEARTVLGAAVIDDIMGLVLLAIVTGVISAAGTGGGAPSAWSVLLVVLKAIVFLVGAIVVGQHLGPKMLRFASRARAAELLLALALGLCFGFGYVAKLIGLAPIIGAFAAGLVLEEVHWRTETERGEHSVLELLKPIVGFLAPIFFFRMGASVDLGTFAHPSAWGLAAALAAAAILGKQACGFGVVHKGISRLVVGIGMVPRGEVILICAAIGTKLAVGGRPVVGPALFSAVVFVVTATTLITPPLLKWSLARNRRLWDSEDCTEGV